MINKTPILAPFPIVSFLEPSTLDQSKISLTGCDGKSKKSCSIPVRVGLFFDGTNNNLERDKNGVRTGVIDPKTKKPSPINNTVVDANDASHSNVARLFASFPSDKRDTGYFRNYIHGVGTPFKEIGELTESDEGKAFGEGGQPRMFAGIPASIDFLGVFDTVATVGGSASVAKTTIAPGFVFDGHWAWANELLKPLPSCVQAGLHCIATHEQRMNFPVTRLKGKIEEVYFPGVHSDVGGGCLTHWCGATI